MKTQFIIRSAASAAMVLLSACASTASVLVLDPVGPATVQSASSAPAGTLVVFSAFSVHAPSPGEPDYRQHYTDYKVYAVNGALLRTVANDAGLAVASPVRVTLAPGSYLVVARANGYGVIKVPVVVANGQATTLHLEGGGFAAEGGAAGSVVRLPDGQVVGWRATR
jgi:hypothetical protein